MADVRTVDIDGSQWSMKDQDARNRIAEIEQFLEPSVSNDFKITLNSDYTSQNIKIDYQQNYGKLHMGTIRIDDLRGNGIGTTSSILIGLANMNPINITQAIGYDYITSNIVRIEIDTENNVRLLESSNIKSGNNRIRIPFIWIKK